MKKYNGINLDRTEVKVVKCSKCKALISADAKFCIECGEQI